MFPKQPVSAVTEASQLRGTKPQGWRPVIHQSFKALRRCSARALFSPLSNLTYLTSCFLGSRMLSSLSAYTFLEAVKRMICKNNNNRKTLISSNILLVIHRSGFWVYLIDLRHALQKLSEERPQAHIHLPTRKSCNIQTGSVIVSCGPPLARLYPPLVAP